jgi:hypothetical protein
VLRKKKEASARAILGRSVDMQNECGYTGGRRREERRGEERRWGGGVWRIVYSADLQNECGQGMVYSV